MLNKLKRIDEHSANIKKETENIKNNPSELENTTTKTKNILQGVNRRLYDTRRPNQQPERQ